MNCSAEGSLRSAIRPGPPRAAAIICATMMLMAVAGATGHDTSLYPQSLLGNAPQLLSDRAVEDWVASELAAKLNLRRGDTLAVTGPPQRIGGWSAYSIRRSIDGVPAAHEDARLLIAPGRRPAHLFGKQLDIPAPTRREPSLEVSDALAAAAVADTDASSARLVYMPLANTLKLSYEVEVSSSKDMVGSERLYVDAQTGAVVARLPLVHGALQRRVYDHASACRSAGVRRPMNAWQSLRLLVETGSSHLARSEGTVPTGDYGVDGLYDLMGELHAFFSAVLGMDSFDGRGATMRSFASVRYHSVAPELPQCVGNGFNASWFETMGVAIFPHRIREFPEVIGHEFGHAVVSHGSRLVYKDEPGALNESIADALGVAFRAWIETGGQLDSPVRDEVWTLRSANAVERDMQNPNRINNLPNHYRDYRFMGQLDNGGVHINSSILNQAFYLLAAGGRHPDSPAGPRVQGIGIAKAAAIFGRAGFNILVPNSDFRDARYAFALVAEILYGQNSEEWVATHMAMDAVGIPGHWSSPSAGPVAVAETARETPTGVTPEAHPPTSPAAPATRERQAASDTTPSQPRQVPMPIREEPDEVAPEPDGTTPPSPAPTGGGHSEPPPASKSETPPPTTETAHKSETPWTTISIAIVLLLMLAALLLVVAAARQRRVLQSRTTAVQPRHNAPVITRPPAPSHFGVLRLIGGSLGIHLNRADLESSEGFVIGRASELCHAQVSDPTVSRRHVRCRLVDSALFVEDLNSRAGTILSGTALKPFNPTKLRQGDTLNIGGLTFVHTKGSRRNKQ